MFLNVFYMQINVFNIYGAHEYFMFESFTVMICNWQQWRHGSSCLPNFWLSESVLLVEKFSSRNAKCGL